MKKHFRIFLAFGFLFFISHLLKASHGLPIVNPSYTIGTTGITISGSSNSATCGDGPFWMQAKVSCSSSDFANTAPPSCLKSYLANWSASSGTTFNAYPWYHALLNVPNYGASNTWSDACTQEPYNNIFIPFSDLCPGEVYYFAFREIVAGGTGTPGAFTSVVSFTVPGVATPKTPGFITSNPVTSPSNPSCGGPVLLTLTPPTGCAPVPGTIPGCTSSSCNQIVWYGPGNTVVAVNTLTVLVNPLVNSTYTVKYDTCSLASRTGCNPPIPPITIYVSNPNATFTSPGTICAGTLVNFTGLFPSGANNWSVSPTTSVTPATSTNTTYAATFDEQGTYTVTHQSINGTCSDTKTQIITVTPGITTSITTSGGGCAPAGSTGAATVAVTSGTTGVTYTWSPTGGNNESATGLAYNTTYTVTISNGGCTITKTVQIANVIADGSFTTSNTNICGGSSITFSAIATSTSTTDSWSVTPTTSVTPATATTPVYTPVFDEAGTYVVTHTSTNGACTDTQTNTITVNPGIVANITTTGGGCSGAGTSGSATVAVTSNTTGITYSWTPSGGTSDVENNIPFNTTYSVTISQGGCVITRTVMITNNPAPSVTSFSVTPPTCNGLSDGIVSVNLAGGNMPFSFTWTPTITQTTQTVTGVGAGTYSVSVRDNNGCTTNSMVTVTEPAVLTLTASPSSTICSGTSATLTAGATGGTPVYSYTWNPGNINGSVPVVVSPTVTSQYTVSVADANGCSQTMTVSVDVTPVLTATATSYSICVGDSILLSPTITSAGNGGPYTYGWTGGATTATLMAYSGSTAGTATYSVSISDGCTVPGAVAEFTVITNPKPNVSAFSVVTPSCSGQTNGSIAASLTSGTAPFTFSWSPAITQTTQVVTGIGAGTYTLFVSDALGCTTQSVVTVTEPPVLSSINSGVATICAGNNGHVVSATPSGGTPAYSYTWSPGSIHTSSFVLTSPTIGTTIYTVVINDANGCALTQTTSVTVKPPLTVSATPSVLCIGESASLVPVITSPGTGGPYTYTWSPGGATTPTLQVTGATAGTVNYVVTVSDGCSPNGTASFTVTTNPTPVAIITGDNLAGNAPLTVNFTDLGTGGNTYNWNFGNGNASVAQNPSQIYENGGTYQVTYTVTSSSGCKAYDTLSVLVIDLIPSIIVPNVFTPNGDRANDFFAITGINITSFECSIFNRWGKEVFTSSDIKNPWDGRINGNPADEGTYYYIIKAGGATGDDIKKQGYLTLFR